MKDAKASGEIFSHPFLWLILALLDPGSDPLIQLGIQTNLDIYALPI
jgi:hypothetical protein